MVTILHTADLHLGRHPTRIPAGLDGPTFSGRATWASIVEHAVKIGVDAVTVSGDVVDRENRYFEAFGAFGDGARVLDEAGIPLVVVGGNHDFDVLPRMVDDLDLGALTLLGRDGSWQRHTIEADGEALVHIDGWSFPAQHQYTSPLDEYDPPRATDAPVVGLLHADIDDRGSTYAPVSPSDLAAAPPDAWLLGHVHAPAVRREAGPFTLYPGSPQPLHPGEPGAHGPWLVDVAGSGRVEARQVPLATLRYDELAVDATDATDPKAVAALVSAAVDAHAATLDTQHLHLFLPRVRLTGRTPAHRAIHEARSRIEEDFDRRVGSVPVVLERLRVDTRPDVDLEELSGGGTPAGVVAGLLLSLEGGEGSVDAALVADALDAITRARDSSAYTPLRREGRIDAPTPGDAIGTLRDQARLLLDALLAQKEAPS